MKQLLIPAICITLAACSGTRPVQLGSENNQLTPCPDKPNCVSSLADKSSEHFIKPLKFDDQKAAHATLTKIISETDSAEVIVNTPNYVYAEYTSDMMRFVDDVEFLFNSDEKQVEVRSASRLGYKDFNVNRERIEAIRTQFSQP